MADRSLTFRVVYNLSYGLVHLVLIGFLLVTPGDLINQALGRSQSANIIVIIMSCVASVTIIFLVHVTRLVLSRSVLASIPKAYIPIEKGDVREDVRVMIADGLGESAAVAFRARPRIETVTETRTAATRAQNDDAVVTFRPGWGDIEHAGWASPTSPDLPNLQYSAVIGELPHLIEAKALTLASPGSDDEEPGYLDAETASLLQRDETMGLREYLVHLAEMGILAGLPAGVTKEFISQYEYARFSTRPLCNARFRDLMNLFAQMLRGMGPPDADVLHAHDGHDDGDFSDHDSHSDGDVDDNAPMATNPSTPGRNTPRKVGAGSSPVGPRRFSSSSASFESTHPQRWRLAVRTPSTNTWQLGTAPTSPRTPRTPRNRHLAASGTGNDGREASRSSSASTFAQTRRPYGAPSLASSHSDGGSVIRLATREHDTEMPYVLLGTGGSARDCR